MIGGRLARSHPELWQEMWTARDRPGARRRQAAELRRDAAGQGGAVPPAVQPIHVAAAGRPPHHPARVRGPGSGPAARHRRRAGRDHRAVQRRARRCRRDLPRGRGEPDAARQPPGLRALRRPPGHLRRPEVRGRPRACTAWSATARSRGPGRGPVYAELPDAARRARPAAVIEQAPPRSTTPRRRESWLAPVAAAAVAARVGGGVGVIAPRLAASSEPAPAAVTAPAPVAVPVRRPCPTAPGDDEPAAGTPTTAENPKRTTPPRSPTPVRRTPGPRTEARPPARPARTRAPRTPARTRAPRAPCPRTPARDSGPLVLGLRLELGLVNAELGLGLGSLELRWWSDHQSPDDQHGHRGPSPEGTTGTGAEGSSAGTASGTQSGY